MVEFLEVVATGCGVSWQDAGRPGWSRFGVPAGGSMDVRAAGEANRLAGNTEDAVVLELVLRGAEFRALRPGWLAVAGAEMGWPAGSAQRLVEGQRVRFPLSRAGVYAYLAAPGGWSAPRMLGSASVLSSGGLGVAPSAGEVLCCLRDPDEAAWAGVVRRRCETLVFPTALQVAVWPGSQWGRFAPEARAEFFRAAWVVSANSNRMGIRLEGHRLQVPGDVMLSEPVRPGSIQVTGEGQPVITMRDGPTVGGYPKIGWLDEEACRRVAQLAPGGTLRFIPNDR